MEKQKKHRSAPFSDLPIWLKMTVLLLLLVTAVCLSCLAMLKTVKKIQQEKYYQMEVTAITSAEQIMNMSIETAVSIAKNIYTNDAIYEFLNTRYASASAYYETYYPLQQNTVMNMAETNIVKSCTIYTENPTVLVGGNIQKLEPAKSEYWYQCFQNMGKPTILCVDPDTATPVLVRKLDYRSLSTGESYLCLEMNKQVLTQFVEKLEFADDLFVIGGGSLLYSSSEDVKTIDDLTITPDFECITRNYYSLDYEYYSRSKQQSIGSLIIENKWLLIGLVVVLLLVMVCCIGIFFGMGMRISPVLKAFGDGSSIPELSKGTNGKDELGRLLDICGSLAERIQVKGDESQQNSESLMRKSTEYQSLFETAMRLDAELVMRERLPDLVLENTAYEIPLAKEVAMLKKIASKLGAKCISDEIPAGQWKIPVYSLALIADDVFRRYIDPSVTITIADGTARITFESPKAPKQLDSLKLRAIFEDSNVSEVYDFNRSYRFNPYMRLKSCLGDRADIEIIDKNMFKFTLKITQQGGIS